MGQVSRKCYCAFCRSARLVYRKKHVSLADVFLAALASALLSLLVWQDLDPRAVMFFALGVGVAEIFVLLRWRLSIACPHCGFDPVLYKKNKPLASERVKQHMDRRREDPLFVLAPPPQLPVVVKRSQSNSAIAREK